MINSLVQALVGSPARKLITGITAIFAFVAAIGGAVKAWPDLEPGMPALRHYVRSEVTDAERRVKIAQEGTVRILRDLQIEQAEGKRDRIENDIAKWALERGKTQDPGTAAMIDEELRRSVQTKQRIDRQIETLTRMRGD